MKWKAIGRYLFGFVDIGIYIVYLWVRASSDAAVNVGHFIHDTYFWTIVWHLDMLDTVLST